MSSTNVHSEQENNIFCAGAQIVPTEREVEIPPKSAKRGPSRLDVMLGEGMEISVGESELHKNGQLVAKDGAEVAKFDAKAFSIIVAKYNRTNRRSATKNVKSSSKGEDR